MSEVRRSSHVATALSSISALSASVKRTHRRAGEVSPLMSPAVSTRRARSGVES